MLTREFCRASAALREFSAVRHCDEFRRTVDQPGLRPQPRGRGHPDPAELPMIDQTLRAANSAATAARLRRPDFDAAAARPDSRCADAPAAIAR